MNASPDPTHHEAPTPPAPFDVLVTAAHWAEAAQDMVREAGGRVHCMAGPVTEDALAEQLAATGAQALVLRGSPPVTERVLAAAPALRIVAKNGAGVDSVDREAARRRGVAVAVAPGANADAVAEHALALMLALTRQLPELDRRVRAGGWAGSQWQGRDFRGSTVGIVGYGSIGRATARLAAALGAQVLVLRPPGQADGFATEPDLDRLLARVDILSLHCPLTERTRGLIGARELGLMRPGSLLVNTARGPVVQEDALIAALHGGQLAGAGLDTFDTEPLPERHPLAKLPQVLLTPHVAGVTRDAALRVATLTARNILDHLRGRALPAGHLLADG
ncbi:D-3-phosphoglycerate dehydrogenase [Paracidovorax anthurii]|uniref:D-3-phosphoglycerate dehydrogenase n=1 Tax=Paracidovorax anthurii TaxID=78229 RepID=A0A328YCJ5_9BURK|nr:hydroxyacid dehydrogenase [Paracidovorax anthurii]RAR71649.1 D-3-phosphoglycerate dehydrogenase [Paracidovorax anthurii]